MLLKPAAWGTRCGLCLHRRMTTTVVRHRDGRPGVFWKCGNCRRLTAMDDY
jgi:hypothetical protein